MGSKLIEKIRGELTHYGSSNWRGSFCDFLDQVSEDPFKYTRTSFQLLNDMVHHFGSYKVEDCGDEITRFKLFDDPFNKGEHSIYGQDRTLMKLISVISTIAESNGDERILVLHGPVGSAKTSMIRLMIEGLEEYSKTEEGAIYRFNWVFPFENTGQAIGFNQAKDVERMKSYALLEDERLLAQVPCQINDNPLLLLPKRERREFLERLVESQGENIDLIPKKVLEGQLCYNCQTIYNKLLTRYEGNVEKVLKHVQVEKMLLSEITKKGIATMQPEQNADGNAPIALWENSGLQNLSHILKGIELNKFDGKWAYANRGLMHLTDMFKKFERYLLPLLSALSESIVDFNGTQGFIDTVMVGTTNLEQLMKIRQNIENLALEDRLLEVDIGYVLKVSEEEKIYEKKFERAGYNRVKKDKSHVTPHSMEMLALWSVLTRLNRPLVGNYKGHGLNEKKLKLIEKMNPIVKAMLYDGKLHDSLLPSEKKELSDKYFQQLIRNEFVNDNVHTQEGIMFGVSPRCVQDLITRTISAKELFEERRGLDKKCLDIQYIFNSIKDTLTEGKEKFLQRPVPEEWAELKKRGFLNFPIQFDQVINEYDRIIQQEIKDAIIGIEPELLEQKVREYVANAEAFINKKKVLNPLTNKLEDPDEGLMRWFEKRFSISSKDKEDFRDGVLKTMANAYIEASINSKGKEIDLREVQSDLFEFFEEGLFADRLRQIRLDNSQILELLDTHGTPRFETLHQDKQELLENILESLKSNYNYCDECAPRTLKYALQRKIIDFEEFD